MKYLVAVALLTVLAVSFGVLGTVAPPLPESETIMPQQGEDSESVGHFANPPTYDSGWVDIRSKVGQYVTLKHDLNTTEVVVDIIGRQSLSNMSTPSKAWSTTYGGTGVEEALCVIQTSDGGYALAGYTNSFGADGNDFYLVKTDAFGNEMWDHTYGGTGDDICMTVVQKSDGGYLLAGYSDSPGTAGNYDFRLIKTDAVGWDYSDKFYGGTGADYCYSVVQTSDGGYALAGYSDSPGTAGGYDFLLVIDAQGHWMPHWFGGTGTDICHSMVQTSDDGYLLAGGSDSSGTTGGYDFWLVKTDALGTKLWDRFNGGTGNEAAYSVVQTSDGGYALAGISNSLGTAGGYDFWLVKTDALGWKYRDRFYGGTGADYCYSMVQTSDDGFALAGYSNSLGTAGGTDFLLVRTDLFGNRLWGRMYGGSGTEYGYSVVQTTDGGYALAGCSTTFGVDGIKDFWLIKLNAEMNLDHQRNSGGTGIIPGWTRFYGFASSEDSQCVVQTSDGGYALAGYSDSDGVDVWLVKTDAFGNMLWSEEYIGTGNERAYSIVQTSDGGYALAGYSDSPGTAGGFDVWLVKTDALGTKLWSKFYGGTGNEGAYSVVQTSDGGYALAGYSNSLGTAGGYDFWLVKTDALGTKLWDRFYGGTGTEECRSMVQTSDGGYALAGVSNSPGSSGGDDFYLVVTDASGLSWDDYMYGSIAPDHCYSVIQTSDGGYVLAGYSDSDGVDFWLVKTDALGTKLWDRFYGGTGTDICHSIVQTSDGGYAIAGNTASYGPGIPYSNYWLVKTDSVGNKIWDKTYGGTGYDHAYSLIQTSDGGYVLAGESTSPGTTGGLDAWLVKTDVEGGLSWTGLTKNSITLYRGSTDPYWNYVRVRIWLIQEPTWIYGDINQDGIVDVNDLYILSRNYGKTFSLLSITGIIAIAGIRIVKKRKQNKQPNYSNIS